MAARLDIDALHRALTTPGAEPFVTARDVALFAKEPFSLWCSRHAPESERDPPSQFEEMLREKGIEHERRVLSSKFPDAVSAPFATEEEGFRELLRAMAAGAPAIAGLPLVHAPRGVRGRIDVLERRDDAPSRFGAWHYVVKEIKLAKNLRDDHRLQAALYHWALGDVQGYHPPAFYLVDRDQEEFAFSFHEPELLATIRGARAVISGEIEPDAVYGEGAPPWQAYADKRAIQAGDVTLVDGVAKKMREKLVAIGLRTVADLRAASREQLTAVPGIGEKTAARLLRNSEALASGAPIRLAPLQLPHARTEVYFDLEGTGEHAEDDGLPTMDYLIGAWTGGRYHAFVAKTADEAGERAMFREFLAWFATLDDPALYHWHHYERTHLKKLVERHGSTGGAFADDADGGRAPSRASEAPSGAPELHARLFASLHDLHRHATHAFAFPTYGTSIKKIAPYCGFRWRHKDVNAMESIALYDAYATRGDVAALQKVLDYNEDDCKATEVVKDWLVSRAP